MGKSSVLMAFAVAMLAAGVSVASSTAARAQDCSVLSTATGTFIGITDQGPGGFGDPTAVEQFLIANGIAGAERVDKVDGFPNSGSSNCLPGESQNVNAQSTVNPSKFSDQSDGTPATAASKRAWLV